MEDILQYHSFPIAGEMDIIISQSGYKYKPLIQVFHIQVNCVPATHLTVTILLERYHVMLLEKFAKRGERSL